MYRQLPRASSRKLSGHICLSCRRQYNASTQQQNHGSDDWLSNFNDLSIAQETKLRPKRRSRQENTRPADPNPSDPNHIDLLKAKLRNAGKDGRKKTPSLDLPSDEHPGVKQSSSGGHDSASTTSVGHDGPPSDRVRSAFESVLAAYGAKSLPASVAEVVNKGDAAKTRGALEGRLQATLEKGPEGVQENAASGDLSKFRGHSKDLAREMDPASESQNLQATLEKGPEGVQGNAASSGTSKFQNYFKDLLCEVIPVLEPQKNSHSEDPRDQVDRARPSDHSNQSSAPVRFHYASRSSESATPVPNPDDSSNGSLGHLPAVTKARLPSQYRDDEAAQEPVVSDTRKSQLSFRALRREIGNLRKKSIAADSQAASKNAPAPRKTSRHGHASSMKATQDQGETIAEAMTGQPIGDALNSGNQSQPPNQGDEPPDNSEDAEHAFPTIKANDLHVTALDIEQPPVPGLAYGLDKVLFNTGVTSLQDQHSGVYNFDPYLQHIMPVEEFDFNSLQQYKTSSQDTALSDLAKSYGKKYMGSTSSMTSTLSHFHYLLSNFRDLNHEMLSKQFPAEFPTFTILNRAPTAVFLRWKNGTYAIDADKEFDHGNVLMMLGKSMEKLLTMPKSEYERYRKSDPRQISDEERQAPEAYQYTTMGDFLMRSQLDAYDPRLPGTGMFDIKTRAVASIRMSAEDFKPMLGYELISQQGKWESYEREYYDMTRSTMLKYMLQARMGRMDGIFLTYHNVQRIFGFQYLNISEIDRAIHGQIDRCLGDQEFKISLDLLNKVLERATAKFPEKSLRFHFETRASPVTALYVFAEPMEEEQIDEIQSKSKDRIADFERRMMGIEEKEEDSPDAQNQESVAGQEKATQPPSPDEFQSHAPLFAATIIVASRVNGKHVERPQNLKPTDEWNVDYLFKEMENPGDAWATLEQSKVRRKKTLMSAISVDEEGGIEGDESTMADFNYEMHDEDGQVRTFDNFFLEKLRKLAEQGREFRRKMDEAEEGREKVVWREGALEQHEKMMKSRGGQKKQQQEEELPSVNGADDYMEWLFKGRKS